MLITLSGKEIYMHLVDDVYLIESEILATPIIHTFERSGTWPASYELSDLEKL